MYATSAVAAPLSLLGQASFTKVVSMLSSVPACARYATAVLSTRREKSAWPERSQTACSSAKDDSGLRQLTPARQHGMRRAASDCVLAVLTFQEVADRLLQLELIDVEGRVQAV